jgi:Phosphohistidine phosphatase SixA
MRDQKQLMLLRHAKSAWDNLELSDHDRPLAPRGMRGAKQMGRYIGHHQLWPQRVLCSSATRALDTFELVEQHWGTPDQGRVEVTIDRSLYLCGVDGFMKRIQQITSACDRLMIVAHNPDLHDLALALTHANQRDTPPMQKLRHKFPTAALTIADLKISNWSNFDEDVTSEISLFETPKTIMVSP